jgi:hypothetical protein
MKMKWNGFVVVDCSGGEIIKVIISNYFKLKN